MRFMKQYFVYIARCSDGTLYTGYCADLLAREKKHNEGDGAKYTKYRTPVAIVHSEIFESRALAMQREAQIKRWSRIKKEDLIKSNLPR